MLRVAAQRLAQFAPQQTARSFSSTGPALGTVTVCGGGNAAHVAAGMFARAGQDVNLFFSFEEEAEKFKKGCDANGGVTVKMQNEEYTAKPALISHKPEDVIPQSDNIMIITPAFAHESILETIKPHLTDGTAVGAIPGPGGFDLLAKHVLAGDIASKDLTIYGGSSLPWACRTEEYGAQVSLLGAKSEVDITAYPQTPEKEAALEKMLNETFLLTKFNVRGNFLVTTLWPTNCVIHTGIMYGLWHDWDGKPVSEAPLFYQNTNDVTGAILDNLSQETCDARDAIQAATGVDLSHLLHIHPYITAAYKHEIKDPTSTATAFASNNAFRGLTCPMVEVEGGLIPNFHMRYLLEDLPHGLAVLRGVAEIAGTPSPTMDKVLTWAQEKCGHEYLVDGKIQGKDVAHSGCPQRFGIKTPQELLA